MTQTERAMVRTLYKLHVELFDHQGHEIEALQAAVQSLRRSHDIIGELIDITAKLFAGEPEQQ